MNNAFETLSGPLFAADFDYFRIPREKWELMLARLRQLGINILTVTLPWGFHQVSPDAVDLTGTTNPRRSVVGLLDLCREFGFLCLLQPGPYSDSGVLGNGIPLWYLKKSDQSDTIFRDAVVGWYRAVSRVLVGRQWPDGPIIALRLESQPTETEEPFYSEELTEVAWRIWLRKHYDGVDALNQAYGAGYHSVNEVAFPLTWYRESTPVEKDARAFLDQVRAETREAHLQTLLEAGWQIPIYPAAPVDHPELPEIQNYSLLAVSQIPDLAGRVTGASQRRPALLNFQHPIEVDPDPVEAGSSPAWATGAPIRPDGSARFSFWTIRQQLWPYLLPVTAKSSRSSAEAGLYGASFEGGGLLTAGGSSPVRLAVAKGTRPAIYQLRLTGEALAEDRLQVSRGYLAGQYVAEDDLGQTDLVFWLDDPAASLPGFLAAYLKTLLAAQVLALQRAAILTDSLSQTLAPDPGNEPPVPTALERPRPTSYTLSEARRGLREADAALRRAMAAIGDLETGFDIILDKRPPAAGPGSAAAPVTIRPDVFEGPTREILIDAGAVCAGIAPRLNEVAGELRQLLAAPAGLSLPQYQQGYLAALAAARNAEEPLRQVLARLRLELAAAELPLVLWRVHNQVQESLDSLRWGVLRG